MITLESVSKRFGSKTIVHNLTFEVKRGEIVGFFLPAFVEWDAAVWETAARPFVYSKGRFEELPGGPGAGTRVFINERGEIAARTGPNTLSFWAPGCAGGDAAPEPPPEDDEPEH